MRHTIGPAAVTLVGLVVALALFRPGTSSSCRAGPRIRPVASLMPSVIPQIEPSVIVTEHARVRVVTVTDALVEPWALAFLAGGDIFVTEVAAGCGSFRKDG
jgi:glucose/arabinose dehydrogenase